MCISKANRTTGFLRHNLKINSVTVKEKAYNTLVRPLVEYASTVWDPYTKAHIDKVEIWSNVGVPGLCLEGTTIDPVWEIYAD